VPAVGLGSPPHEPSDASAEQGHGHRVMRVIERELRVFRAFWRGTVVFNFIK
jgi:hypothetical protein